MLQQQPRMSSVMKEKAEKMLVDSNVMPGSTVMEAKKELGTVGQKTSPILTNMYRLDMLNQIRINRYEVVVCGVTRNGREVDLAVRSPSDYTTVDRRTITNAVFLLYKQHIDVSAEEGQLFFYDLQHILFTLKPLDIAKEGVLFSCKPDALANANQEFDPEVGQNFTEFRLRIIPTDVHRPITLADFSYLSNDSALTERSIEQFLDIATVQEVFNNPGQFVSYSAALYYLLNPGAFGFRPADCPPFPSNCSFLGIGVSKGVRPIQDANGKTTAGIVVQVKKSPFHIDLDSVVSQKMRAVMQEFRPVPATAADLHRKLEPFVKGIWVETTYAKANGRKQKFEIGGLSATDSRTQKIVHDPKEGPISIAQYYNQHYGITLAHPQLLLCIRKAVGRDTCHYPAELLRVLDNQRVKSGQQNSQAAQQMIRQIAVPPSILIEQNRQVKASLQLDNSPYMTMAGLRMASEPIEVQARVLPHPELQFTQRTERPKVPEATWRGVPKYVIPAKCDNWAAIAFTGRGREMISENEWRKFVGIFVQRVASTGMQFAPVSYIEAIFDADMMTVNKKIREYSTAGFEYLLIAHPDGADDIHHAMKFIEQSTEMITQGIRHWSVKNVNSGKHLTLENFVHKTNLKMGGLNYVIVPGSTSPTHRELFSNETLIIGFAMSHPGTGMINARDIDGGLFGMDGENGSNGHGGNGSGNNGNGNGNGANGHGKNGNGNGSNNGNGNGAAAGPSHGPVSPGMNGSVGSQNGSSVSNAKAPLAPSVIGFAANIGKNNYTEFLGDYYYQEPLRDEKVELIAHITKRCLLQFHEFKGIFPKRVIIYRNGCAEGAFQNILRYEVPMVKQAMAEVGCPQAKITLMVVNKKQPVRVYPKNVNSALKASEQNIKPGTVIDTGIVHPIWGEFFLCPHRGIQGTSAISRYNILVDENKLSTDTLQTMTHHLAFGHQIVYSPTSLPSPVFIAEECAKRGRNNYNVWATELRRLQEDDNGEEVRVQVRNYEELSAHLNMEHTEFLRCLRYNA